MKSTDNVTLNRLLMLVARQGASDLHLTVGSPPVIRKEGELYQLEGEEILTAHFIERILESFLSPEDRLILEKEQEIVVTYTFNKILRYRISIYKQKGYFSATFRYIQLLSKKIADLELPPYLEKAARYKNGLIMVAGVYDSGKNTTAAAVVNTLNELGPPRYINTLEKPVEYLFSNNMCIIEQREVGKDVASYTQGLQLVLEGDIDMVVIDRVDNQKTMKKILEVLEAGRLVLLIVTASSSVSALGKLTSLVEVSEVGWAYKVLAQHLQCVLMQKLIHRIGGGRVLIYEFLVNTGVVPGLIAMGNLERIPAALMNSQDLGMTTMERILARLVQKGEVKLEDAMLEANDKNYLKNLLR